MAGITTSIEASFEIDRGAATAMARAREGVEVVHRIVELRRSAGMDG